MRGEICIIRLLLTKIQEDHIPFRCLSLGSDSNLLLCEMASLAALHMWAVNERKVCSPLHHNLLFIKRNLFSDPFVPFYWTANSDKVPESMLFNDDIWELSWGCCQIRGCAVGVNLGDDTWRINKKYGIFFRNSKRLWWSTALKMSGNNWKKLRCFNSVKLNLTLTITAHSNVFIYNWGHHNLSHYQQKGPKQFNTFFSQVICPDKFWVSSSCIWYLSVINTKCGAMLLNKFSTNRFLVASMPLM